MKLTRFYENGAVVPGVFVSENEILNCADFGEDWGEAFFENDGLKRLENFLQEQGDSLPRVNAGGVTLAPAVARPSKIVCIGLNYASHAEEAGMEAPSEPIVFFKATTAWAGPNDDIVIPRDSNKTDWEVELAVVIGKRAKYVSEDEALNYVAGYGVHNDYSEREWQLEKGGQWVKGKSVAGSCGPLLVTKDEIKDINDINLILDVNGERRQTGNTSRMIFNFNFLISHISQFMVLYPGTIITTGTPAGTAMEMKDPKFLKKEDKIYIKIDHLGEQNQTVIEE